MSCSLLGRCLALAKNRVVPLRQMAAAPRANPLESSVLRPVNLLNRSYVSVAACLNSKDLRHGDEVHKKSVEKQLSAKIQQKMEKLKADDDELEQTSARPASASQDQGAEEAPKEVPLTQAEKEEAEIEKTRQIFINAKAALYNDAFQPTKETLSLLKVNGVPYEKLNIVSIFASKNNTILTLSDWNGIPLYSTSAGSCGFKNSKKSTSVAGQAAGIAMSDHIKRRGIKDIRAVVKGFGNGRLAALKAMHTASVNVVSITDRTPIPIPYSSYARPPGRRRV